MSPLLKSASFYLRLEFCLDIFKYLPSHATKFCIVLELPISVIDMLNLFIEYWFYWLLCVRFVGYHRLKHMVAVLQNTHYRKIMNKNYSECAMAIALTSTDRLLCKAFNSILLCFKCWDQLWASLPYSLWLSNRKLNTILSLSCFDLRILWDIS